MKPSVMRDLMSREVLDDATQHRAGAYLISWAQRLGIDVESVESWGQLATLVRVQMGGKCFLCDATAGYLSFWTPVDPSLIDPEVSIGYLHCGEHEVDEIEAKIAEKHARTS
jgi:hypothetical protein